MSYFAWLVVCCFIVVVIAVITGLMHAVKWISLKGEHPVEHLKVNSGVRVFFRHYSSELRNELENHQYFPWLYKFLFKVLDTVSYLCRGIAHITRVALKFLKSIAVASKGKFAAWRQARIDAEASSRHAVNKIIADAMHERRVEALRGRCQSAPEQTSLVPGFAKQAEAEAAKIYQNNFAKNDPSPKSTTPWDTVELKEKTPLDGSDVVDALEKYFPEPAKVSAASKEQLADARRVHLEKLKKTHAELSASIDELTEKRKPTTTPAAKDTVAEIPADKISADETTASKVAPKVAAIPKAETVDQVLGKVTKKIHRKERIMEDEKIPAGVSELSDLDRQIAIAKKEDKLWSAKLAAATTQKSLAKKEKEVEVESLDRDKEAIKRLRYETNSLSPALSGAIDKRITIARKKATLARAVRKTIIAQLQTMAITPANARLAIQAGAKMLADAEFSEATVIE